jgi:hypothetical protein
MKNENLTEYDADVSIANLEDDILRMTVSKNSENVIV